MSMAAELLSIKNPNIGHGFLPLKRASFYSPTSVKFESLLRLRGYRVSIEAPKGLGFGIGIGIGLPSLDRRNSWDRSVVAFAASHEESVSSTSGFLFWVLRIVNLRFPI